MFNNDNNNYNNSREIKGNKQPYKINNIFNLKNTHQNLRTETSNLFNKGNTRNINPNHTDTNNYYTNNTNSIYNSEKKTRDRNFTNYSKFQGGNKNQPYVLISNAFNTNNNNLQNYNKGNINGNNNIHNNMSIRNNILSNNIFNNNMNNSNYSNGFNNNIIIITQKRRTS